MIFIIIFRWGYKPMMDLSRDTVDGCESQRNPELIGGKHLIILSWAFNHPFGGFSDFAGPSTVLRHI